MTAMEQMHSNNMPRARLSQASFAPSDSNVMEYRLLELETEKIRLQQLVTELLIKNQKLRENLDRIMATATGSDACCTSFHAGAV